MEKTIRAAAYCRVSTDQSDQLNSLSNQIKYFTDYINAHPGWQLAEIYSDEGISGTSTNKRVNFNRMIADAEAHKMDLILTKEVSRFARNTIDTLEYTRRLKALNVYVVFINDNINTSVYDDEFQLTLMAALAQKESARTSERVKWGQKRSMENGVVFGRDLLGYTVQNGTLKINSEEAQTVRLIYHKYLHEGKGTHVIAGELAKAGILPKRGTKWSNTVILRILRNEKYVGDLIQQKTYTPNYLDHRKKQNRGDLKTVFIKSHHEPIIDRVTWEKTQQELKRRSPSRREKFSNRYWCSGKLICGECGGKFISRIKQLKDGSTYHTWRCSESVNYRAEKDDSSGDIHRCRNSSVSEKVLRACVRQVLLQVPLQSDVIIRDMIKDILSVQSYNRTVDRVSLQNRIAALETKKEKAIDLALEGTISREDLKEQIQLYHQGIETLRKQIEEESAERIQRNQKREIQADYASTIREILQFYGECDLLYHELVDRIILYKNNILVIYLIGASFGVKLHYKTAGRGENYTVATEYLGLVSSFLSAAL